MKFTEYNSLTNLNLKTIQWHKDHPEVTENVLFNVLEKLHGCNYQFASTTDGEVKYGKRTCFLPEEANFYGQQFIIAEHTEGFQRAVSQLYAGQEVVLFGEMFGGSGVEGKRPVQVEVFYCKHFNFAGFDLMVDGEYKPYSDMVYFCEVAGIPTPPLLGENLTLWEALKVDNKFNSKWSEESEEMDGNICEGTVITPTEPVFFGPEGNEARLIFKNKNEIFLEKHAGKKPSKTASEMLSPEMLDLFIKINEYITPQRFTAVVSKMLPEEVVFKNFAGILNAYISDVYKEVEEEGIEVTPYAKTVLHKTVHNESAKTIREGLMAREKS